MVLSDALITSVALVGTIGSELTVFTVISST